MIKSEKSILLKIFTIKGSKVGSSKTANIRKKETIILSTRLEIIIIEYKLFSRIFNLFLEKNATQSNVEKTTEQIGKSNPDIYYHHFNYNIHYLFFTKKRF